MNLYSEQGLILQHGQNEYNKSYAMIKTEPKVKVSQQILNQSLWELQTMAHFSDAIKTSTISQDYTMIKTE